MKEKLLDILEKIPYYLDDFFASVRLRLSLNRFVGTLKNNRMAVAAFLTTFVVFLIFYHVMLVRISATRHLKADIAYIQDSLNTFGLDIAYEKISFSSSFTRPLMTADDFRLYSLNGNWSLTIPRLRLYASIFNNADITLELGNKQELQLNGESYPVRSEEAEIKFDFGDNNDIELVLAEIRNINIKNFAVVQELNLAGRHTPNRTGLNSVAAVFENHIELKNITLNGLLNYPLTSQISRLYLKTNLMGEFSRLDSFAASMEEWLHRGGFLEIPNMVVNWAPFSMVGKGELNFDETFAPNLHLETSSKALVKFMEDLQDRNFLERKGVFVANILLSNKAFKLNEDDEHLTIVTPIDYRNHKLAVENITVKTFYPMNSANTTRAKP